MLKQKQRNKLKRYVIPVQWMMSDEIEVEAYSLEEAKEIVKQMPLTQGEYIDDSFKINEDLLLILNPHVLDE
ncbi:hypothetical protein [Parageobacillus galactosidasius]|uniref:Uncharacterized protein n=1 Tax=Parageobacillus galactosidasius TaxID=883812 RepID=A0A226QRA2_9BACL|nr:hypothetical protein [Parageobacillus galactosidasius]OXB94875.1 hypothetical protein B9L23_08410 [Parageobacillus galactosidasius]